MKHLAPLIKGKPCWYKAALLETYIAIDAGDKITRKFYRKAGYSEKQANALYRFYARHVESTLSRQNSLAEIDSQPQEPIKPTDDVQVTDIVSLDSNAISAGDSKQVQKQEPTQLKTKTDADDAHVVLGIFNEMTGRRQRPVHSNIKHIRARLKEGYSFNEIRAVIACKVKEWKDDPKMNRYIRISTLFNAEKFDGYLQEAADYVRLQQYAEEYANDAKQIIEFWNQQTDAHEWGYDINHRPYHEKIGWWLANGRTVDGLKKVVSVMIHNWSNDFRNKNKLNPNEIFGKNFKQYEKEEYSHIAVGTEATSAERDSQASEKELGTRRIRRQDFDNYTREVAMAERLTGDEFNEWYDKRDEEWQRLRERGLTI